MTMRAQAPDLLDVAGLTAVGERASLSDFINPGRYALVWWHPQALSPLSCRQCGGATPEPIKLLMDIHAAGCDVLGLSYESPDRIAAYLQDIGVEYPVLSVTREDARQHGVAKVEGEAWAAIPHCVAFLVDERRQIINRYGVHDVNVFLRTVLSDVKAGPPPSRWEPVKKTPWYKFW